MLGKFGEDPPDSISHEIRYRQKIAVSDPFLYGFIKGLRNLYRFSLLHFVIS